jgi:ABC-type transporter MlaC component
MNGILILASSSLVWAAEPMDEIRGVVNTAIQVLEEMETKSNHGGKELDQRLEKIIDPVFDFREMAKRSLGITLEGAYPRRAARICPAL